MTQPAADLSPAEDLVAFLRAHLTRSPDGSYTVTGVAERLSDDMGLGHCTHIGECADCAGTGSVPAQGWEPDFLVDNGAVPCPACQPEQYPAPGAEIHLPSTSTTES